jgi:alanine racemase
VRLGYADGYQRRLGGRAVVGHRGREVPVVGRVCMDQLMVDLGPEGDAFVGERVIAFGPGGPDLSDVADRADTIPYELLTGLGSRVSRSYRAGPESSAASPSEGGSPSQATSSATPSSAPRRTT